MLWPWVGQGDGSQHFAPYLDWGTQAGEHAVVSQVSCVPHGPRGLASQCSPGMSVSTSSTFLCLLGTLALLLLDEWMKHFIRPLAMYSYPVDARES